ncbi:hypothetical protein [Chitinimonas arctica]|nr:hypothetical protein [Chitinimonas arctica]
MNIASISTNSCSPTNYCNQPLRLVKRVHDHGPTEKYITLTYNNVMAFRENPNYIPKPRNIFNPSAAATPTPSLGKRPSPDWEKLEKEPKQADVLEKSLQEDCESLKEQVARLNANIDRLEKQYIQNEVDFNAAVEEENRSHNQYMTKLETLYNAKRHARNLSAHIV